MTPNTKAAARESGYLTVQAALSSLLAPRRDAKPTIVEGEQFFLRDQCEGIISRSEAKSRRLRVPRDARPVTILHITSGERTVAYAVYRESDCVPMPAFTVVPTVEIDLLLATFTVNKAAKRYAYSALSNYRDGQHDLARHAKHTKAKLYALKDKGIAEAYRQGRLCFVGTHAKMGLYRGEGYCFHSTLIPLSCEFIDVPQKSVLAETMPRGAKEGRLPDAVHTLEVLPTIRLVFVRSLRPFAFVPEIRS